ncbi:MAG: SDR family oxidoreductase [bacterium]
MDLGLAGKVALVAASSKGLGKAAALGLAKEGAKLVICARNEEVLEAAEEDIQAKTNAEILAVPTDLADHEAIKRLVEAATSQFGTIHVLVNNAGGPPPGFFEDLTDAHWQKGFELTLMSSVRLTREVLPLMKKQKWGRIINVTSLSVKQPIDELLLSNSLRLSILGWAKTLAGRVAADGILVNNVCPGWTRTGRVQEILQARAEAENTTPEEVAQGIVNNIPMGRMAETEEFANLVVFLASERASYITGTSIQVDGGAVKGIF